MVDVLNKNICWREYLKCYNLLQDHGRAWRMSQCDKLPFEAQIELRALIGGGAYDANWYKKATFDKNIKISNLHNNSIKFEIVKKLAKYVFPDKINILNNDNNANILFVLLKRRIATILKHFSDIKKISDEDSQLRYENIDSLFENVISNNNIDLLNDKEFIVLLYGESGYIYKNIDKIMSSITLQKNSENVSENLDPKFYSFLTMTKYFKYSDIIEIVKDEKRLNISIKLFLAFENFNCENRKPEINKDNFFINSIKEIYDNNLENRILDLLNTINDLFIMFENLVDNNKKYYRAYVIANENIDNGVDVYINSEYKNYYDKIIKYSQNKKINSILQGIKFHDQLINYFNHMVSFIRRILNEVPLNFPNPPIIGISNDKFEINYLSNSFEIENEGNEMKHSVGAYADKVIDKKSFYYSYINKISGKRGTIELNTNGDLVDFNGVKNAPMSDDDWNNVNLWLNTDNKQKLSNLQSVFKYGSNDKNKVINLISNYGLDKIIALASSKNYDILKLWISLGNIYNKPISYYDINVINSSIKNKKIKNAEMTLSRLKNWSNYILTKVYEEIDNVR